MSISKNPYFWGGDRVQKHDVMCAKCRSQFTTASSHFVRAAGGRGWVNRNPHRKYSMDTVVISNNFACVMSPLAGSTRKSYARHQRVLDYVRWYSSWSLTAYDVKLALGIGMGQARYSLDRLERIGLIRSLPMKGGRRYYLLPAVARAERQRAA